MFAKPQDEHRWLKQLVGDWKFEHKCQMPDGSSTSSPGRLTCRLLGELWLVAEFEGDSAEGGAWSSIMTLGYDPTQQKYVGTFVGSMMTNLWNYQGVLEADGRRLPLETRGPRFDGQGECAYRDTIEIVDADRWLFTSHVQNDSGEWQQFLDGQHTRA